MSRFENNNGFDSLSDSGVHVLDPEERRLLRCCEVAEKKAPVFPLCFSSVPFRGVILLLILLVICVHALVACASERRVASAS